MGSNFSEAAWKEDGNHYGPDHDQYYRNKSPIYPQAVRVWWEGNHTTINAENGSYHCDNQGDPVPPGRSSFKKKADSDHRQRNVNQLDQEATNRAQYRKDSRD